MMMITRKDIIEGIVSMVTAQQAGTELFNRLCKSLEKFDNDRLAYEYHKSTGMFIRQIFSNQFISLP
jgi:hypothetical protein